MLVGVLICICLMSNDVEQHLSLPINPSNIFFLMMHLAKSFAYLKNLDLQLIIKL